jgi:hypothetical protein
LIASEPNVWRRSWKRSGASPALHRRHEPAPQRRRIGVVAILAGEHEIVRPRELPAAREPADHVRDILHHRDRPRTARLWATDLIARVALVHPDRLVLEVDVAPAERDQLAAAQPGERRRDEDRRVLLTGGGIGSAWTSSGVKNSYRAASYDSRSFGTTAAGLS